MCRRIMKKFLLFVAVITVFACVGGCEHLYNYRHESVKDVTKLPESNKSATPAASLTLIAIPSQKATVTPIPTSTQTPDATTTQVPVPTTTQTPTPTTAPTDPPTPSPVSLRISEVLANNGSYPIDGNLCDWIELYNYGTTDVVLDDFFLSDNIDKPFKGQLSGVISAGEYKVFACKLKDEQGVAFHDDRDVLDFTLSKDGESVFLNYSNGYNLDTLSFGKLNKDVSYCYDCGYNGNPTPGKPNELSCGNSLLSSEILKDFTLDVISLSIDENEFEKLKSNDNKEYLTHITFYENDGQGNLSVGFQYTAGIELYGANSRRYYRQNFQIKFKSPYGSHKLHYQLFEDTDLAEYNTFVLRGSSQDSACTMLRDEYVQYLGRSYFGDEWNVMTERFRPVNLYINDFYYGVYYIREHMDVETVAERYDVEPDTVSIVKRYTGLKDGTELAEMKSFWEFVKKADFTKEADYERLLNTIDIDSLIDFYIVNIWSGNTDFTLHTYKIGDKWIYGLHDFDISLGSTKNFMEFFLGKENNDNTCLNAPIYRLLKRDDFKVKFRERLDYMLSTAYSPEYSLEKLNEFVEILEHDMKYSCEVWGGMYVRPDTTTKYITYKEWEKNIDSLRAYIKERDKLLIDQFDKLYKVK